MKKHLGWIFSILFLLMALPISAQTADQGDWSEFDVTAQSWQNPVVEQHYDKLVSDGILLSELPSELSSSSLEDHWATYTECLEADGAPFYYPTTESSRPLRPNQKIAGLPASGCVLMELPDRLTQGFPTPGRGWVRIEQGRQVTVNMVTGEVEELYTCRNEIFEFIPFTPDVVQGPQGVPGEQGPAGVAGEQGVQGPQGEKGEGFSISWKPLAFVGGIAALVGGYCAWKGCLHITNINRNRNNNELRSELVPNFERGRGFSIPLPIFR